MSQALDFDRKSTLPMETSNTLEPVSKSGDVLLKWTLLFREDEMDFSVQPSCSSHSGQITPSWRDRKINDGPEAKVLENVHMFGKKLLENSPALFEKYFIAFLWLLMVFLVWWEHITLWKGWGTLNPALGHPSLTPSPGRGKNAVRTQWCVGSANRGNVNFCAQFTTLRVKKFNSKCLLKKKLKLFRIIQFSFFFFFEMETRYVYFNKSVKQVNGLNSWCLFLK